jgi:hypothetical protein
MVCCPLSTASYQPPTNNNPLNLIEFFESKVEKSPSEPPIYGKMRPNHALAPISGPLNFLKIGEKCQNSMERWKTHLNFKN